MYCDTRISQDLDALRVELAAERARREKAEKLIEDVYPAFRGLLLEKWGADEQWPTYGAAGKVLCYKMRDFLYPGYATSALDAIAEEKKT